MPKIDLKSLKPGDAIVFINKYYKEGATIATPVADRYQDWEYVDHIAMFSHFDESNNPVVLHSVQGENGRPSGLIESTLQVLRNRSEVIPCSEHPNETRTVHYDVDFHVFRYDDPELAEKACALVSLWSKYDIPYDKKRLNAKIALEDEGYTADKFYSKAQQDYKQIGKFRALKYAVRRTGSLTQSSIHGVGRGLTCSMTFVLAYQVAEMIHGVATLDQVNNMLKVGETKKYNSDKHVVYDADELPPVYVKYLKEIKNTNTLKQDFYVSSLRFCLPHFNIFRFEHRSFPIDCKTIGAAGIHHLFKQNESWKEIGVLELKPTIFTDAQKIAYKAGVAKVKRQKELLRSVHGMQGLFGTQLGENTQKFSAQLRVVTPPSDESKSQPATPEKHEVEERTPKTDPQNKSAKSRVNDGASSVARKLKF